MDNRLVIEPWKVEMVERHFKTHVAVSKESSPPSMKQSDVSVSSSPVVRICRPKLISKLKNAQGEGKDDVTGSSITNIVKTSSQVLAPQHHLSSVVIVSEVPEEFGPPLATSSSNNLTEDCNKAY